MNAFVDVLEPRATPESRLPAHRVGPSCRGDGPEAPPVPIAQLQCWKTKRSLSGAERLRPLQTQPSLHIIRSFSTMNLPSLYFWLSSNASSWRGKRAQQRRQAPPAWARDGSAAHIFPAEDGLADVAVDVADRVQPGDEDALLPRPLGHVDAGTAARGVSGGRKPAPAERRVGEVGSHRLLKR